MTDGTAGPGTPPWRGAWGAVPRHGGEHPVVPGYPAQAVPQSQEALTLAQALAHPHSLVAAQHWAAFLHYRRREVLAVSQANALLALATVQGFPLYVGGGVLVRVGAGRAGQGRGGSGAAPPGHDDGLGDGHDEARPLCLVLLAEAAGYAGQVEEGLPLLAEALAACRPQRAW